MNEEYENQKMLTYIGNKRKLISNIKELIEMEIIPLIQKDKLNIVDGFSGSSVVSRALSQYSETIYSNDIEKYSYIMTYCILVKPSLLDQERIKYHIDTMNKFSVLGKIDRKKVNFIHLNHTNNVIRENSQERKKVVDSGYNIANDGMVYII